MTIKQSTSIKNCVHCKSSFAPTIHHQIYCSDGCRKNAVKERNIELSKTKGLTKVCFTCGIEKPLSEYFLSNVSRYGVGNHCKECEKKQYRKKVYGENQTKKCEICESDFLKSRGKTYCSKRCRKSAETIRNGGIPRPDLIVKRSNPIIDGMRVCTACEQSKPIETGFYWFKGVPIGGVCISCRNDRIKKTAKIRRSKPESKAIRQQERAKMAEKKGMEYIPRDFRKEITALKSSNKPRNARIMLRNFLAESSDKEIACWYTALDKPWLNPRLTHNERKELRCASDIQYKFKYLKSKIRTQVRKYMNRYYKGIESTEYIKNLIGVEIKDLSIHIERQFTKGMNWDKFFNGEIHIDHIIPVSNFDFTNESEIKACWSLPNLRPMWARENILKSNKILTLL